MRYLRQIVSCFVPRCLRARVRAGRVHPEDGSALVELAITMTFFGLPLVIGIASYAPSVYDSIEIANAAHAGAEYGMYSPIYAIDSAGIIAAAQADAPDFGTNLSVTPTVYWACATNQGGTQYGLLATATAACTGANNSALEFIKVYVSASKANPFDFKLPLTNIQFPSTITMSSTAVMEVQQ